MTPRVLILGGTTEGYALAETLTAKRDLQVINSLAGRTASPRLPAGETRIGGFGGAAGLADFLRLQGISAVIDATHPFAASMGWNAAEGCRAAQVALLRLDRPAWTPQPGDRWEMVDDWEETVSTLRDCGARRVLLAVGRQELAAFAGLQDIWFLIRMVTAPEPLPPFPRARLLLARGPFDLSAERELLETHAIDTIVCKNSGGDSTAAKLVAARERGLRVIMRRRPTRPELPLVTRIPDAIAWLDWVLPGSNPALDP